MRLTLFMAFCCLSCSQAQIESSKDESKSADPAEDDADTQDPAGSNDPAGRANQDEGTGKSNQSGGQATDSGGHDQSSGSGTDAPDGEEPGGDEGDDQEDGEGGGEEDDDDENTIAFSSLALATILDDGFLNKAERDAATDLLGSLSAEGFDAVTYRVAVATADCDALAGYISGINSGDSNFSAEGSFKVCIRLTDNEGHALFAESGQFHFDDDPPSAALVQDPPVASRVLEWEFSIDDDGITAYRHKAGDATLDCAATSGYSIETDADTPIEFDATALPEGGLKLCILGLDAAGNWQETPTEITWAKDLSSPGAVDSLSLGHRDETILASWDAPQDSSDVTGYIIVRRTAADITWQPSAGIDYAIGSPDAGTHQVVAKPTALTATDTGLANGTTYFYAVYAHDAALNYSPPVFGHRRPEDPGAGGGYYFQQSFLGHSQAATVAGNSLFMAVGSGGFSIYEDGLSPSLVKHVGHPGWLGWGQQAVGIAVSGDHVYVGTKGHSIAVFDISDRSRPQVVTEFAQGLGHGRMVVDGNYLYEVAANPCLKIFDVSDPTAPVSKGTYGSGKACIDVKVSGNFAYVTAGADGLEIIDVSDKDAPSLVGAYTDSTQSYHVVLDSGFAYISERDEDSTSSNSLHRINISNPANPVQDKIFTLNADFTGLAVENENVFTAGSTGGCGFPKVIDFSQSPPDPIASGCMDDFEEPIDQIFRINGKTYHLSWSGLNIVDDEIAPLAHPSLLPWSQKISLSGNLLYTIGANGMEIHDFSNPSHPRFVGRAMGWASDWGQGTWAYFQMGLAIDAKEGVAAGGFMEDRVGTFVWDVSDPTNPIEKVRLAHEGQDVWIEGDHLYIASAASGVFIASLADLDNIQVIGAFDTPGSAEGIAILGQYAYVADAAEGLLILDVSDPANPTQAGSVNTPGNATALSVAGSKVFLADGSSGLQVVEVGVPASPSIIANYPTPGIARDVKTEGNIIYVSYQQGSHGILVLNAADPADPQLLQDITGNLQPYELAIGVNDIFAANSTMGVATIAKPSP